MTDYLRLRLVSPEQFAPDLLRWQVSEDLIELGDSWSETRKIRTFNFGPALKGAFPPTDQYFPDGLNGAPPLPGTACCEERYDLMWNESLDRTWSRIGHDEFEARFSDVAVLDRMATLTDFEEQAGALAHSGARYSLSHWEEVSSFPGMPVERLSEHVGDRVVRTIDTLKSGAMLRDNLFIQRRREFGIVYFNGSLVEGSCSAQELLTRQDLQDSVREIDRSMFEERYARAAPKLAEDWLLRDAQ